MTNETRSYTEARANIETLLDAQPLTREEIFAGETPESLYAALVENVYAGIEGNELRFTENDLARYMDEEITR